MKQFIAVFIGVVLVLLCAAPVLAAGFSLSPAEVEFDVPADGSTTVEFLVYDFTGDFDISLEDIPLRVEPEKVSVTASAEGTPVELTFYGDESLSSQVFKGKIVFLASSGGNIAFGVKVIATVNHIVAGQPLPETTPPEATPQAPDTTPSTPPGESQAPQESRGLPIGGIIGIAAGTAIVIALIVVLARRRRY